MNMRKLQDREDGKRKKMRRNGKMQKKLIDNDDFFSLFIYHTNEAYSNLFESKS